MKKVMIKRSRRLFCKFAKPLYPMHNDLDFVMLTPYFALTLIQAPKRTKDSTTRAWPPLAAS